MGKERLRDRIEGRGGFGGALQPVELNLLRLDFSELERISMETSCFG
jgi:hypothetical protein